MGGQLCAENLISPDPSILLEPVEAVVRGIAGEGICAWTPNYSPSKPNERRRHRCLAQNYQSAKIMSLIYGNSDSIKISFDEIKYFKRK